MNRRTFLKLTGLGAGASALPSWLRAAGAGARRPNILFILSDDHAAQAISAYGSSLIRTPNIDRLAREGLRLDRCYAANSICSPSRATILTGQYSHKNGMPGFNTFDPRRPTFIKSLHAAGYHTAIIGKWHLESEPSGFDRWEVLVGQGEYWDPVFITPSGRVKRTGYATDVITDRALLCLEQRPQDRPFCLCLHHKAPHRNWQPHPRHAALFKNREIPEPPNLFDDYATRADAIRQQEMSIAKDLRPHYDIKTDPPPGLAGRDLVRWKYQQYMRDYLACCAGVDENIGRVLGWLDRQRLADHTIVIYSSDQGFFLGEHGLFDKRFMYEESDRMPFVLRWPARVRPGTVSDGLAVNCDFAPTLLEAAGAAPLPGAQGVSLAPLFAGGRPATWRKAIYYRYYDDPGEHHVAAHYGVRTDTHKLIYYWRLDQWECFDLRADPHEMRNIYADPAAQPVVAQLKQDLARLRRELDDRDQFADKSSWPKDVPLRDPAAPPARSMT